MKSIFRFAGGGRRSTLLALPVLAVLLAMTAVREASVVHAQIGNVTIQKQLFGPDGVTPVQGSLSGYVFTLTGGGITQNVGPTDNNGMAATGIAPGAYSISEQPKAGSTLLGFTLNGTQTGSFTVASGQTVALIARNQVAGTASIAIQKQVVDANNAAIPNADRSGFQFTVAGPNGVSLTATTDANGLATVGNLAAGTYSVTEQPKTGFVFSAMSINGVPSSNGQQFNLTAGATSTVIVQNKQGTAGNTVTITKQVVDANGNAVASASRAGFQFTITCGASTQNATSDANGTATIANVPAGSCTFTEAAATGLSVRSIAMGGTTITNGGTFTMPAAATAITVQNQQGGGTGATEQVQLFTGCNNVATTFPTGTTASTVAAGVSPAGNLIAMWFFINAQQRFVGFSPLPGAPNDLTTTNRGDPLFICMTGPGTFTRPQI